MKRLTALFLAIALTAGLTVTAFAYNGENNGYYNGLDNGSYENGNFPAVWEMFERPFGNYPARRIFGFIGEVTQAECGNYTAEILNADGDVMLVVWMLDGIVGHAVIDAVTGFPAQLEDHGDGEVLVIYGPLYTGHEIPQSNALVIAINVEATAYNVMPHHHTIESINWDEDETSIRVTVDNGGLIVTLNEDTDLQAWLTRQVVLLDEFRVGDEVLLWYGMVATSYPAFAHAARALRLVPAGADLYDQPEYPYNDQEPNQIELGELVGAITRVGIDLYRVNLNAEAMGYTVTWNAQLRRAELTLGEKVVTLAPGFAIFYVNGVAHTMSAPSLLDGGRLFAPADFFEALAVSTARS